MDIYAWLLVGVLACLVTILCALLAVLRSWKRFIREHREGQESLKKLLLGNFADLLELQRKHASFEKKESANKLREDKNGAQS